MDIDSVITRVLLALGGLSVLVGVALMATGAGAGLPFGVEIVYLVGVVAGLLGLLNVRQRLQGEITETVTPDPERPADNPTPGEEVDRMLYEMTTLRQGMAENREHLEDRLERLAVAVVQNREDCTAAEAREILESGEWTDDEAAAALFQGERTEGERSGLSQALRGETDDAESFEEQFRAAVEALIDIADVDVRELDRETAADDDGFLGGLFGGSDDDGDEGVVANWNARDSSVASFDPDEPFEDVSLQRTNRWLGVSAFALVALGVGIFTQTPGLLLGGSVGVAYTVYARVTAVPPVQHLTVEREFEETDLDPGDETEVTVTVRNDSGSLLPDLRFVDVVPDAFVVTDGVPRLHTALQAGAEATFSYHVRVERGQYQWPLLTMARDFSGGVERTSLITPDAQITIVPSLTVTNEVPVRAQTTQYAGDVNTKVGGSGLEFHSVREYRPGDPMNRINWKKKASTGDMATIDFRQEKAANVTILFDTRQSAYVSPGPGKPHAVDSGVHAASDVFGALYDQGNLVGVAAFDTVPCWFAPGAGSEHREHARMLFAQHPALSPRPPNRQDNEGQYIDPMTHVRRRLPSNSQVFLFTPLADDYASEVARRLDSEGHLVTVISPDVTVDETVGQRLTRVERAVRVRYLRERGLRVIDWQPDERLSLQFDKARKRWA